MRAAPCTASGCGQAHTACLRFAVACVVSARLCACSSSDAPTEPSILGRRAVADPTRPGAPAPRSRQLRRLGGERNRCRRAPRSRRPAHGLAHLDHPLATAADAERLVLVPGLHCADVALAPRLCHNEARRCVRPRRLGAVCRASTRTALRRSVRPDGPRQKMVSRRFLCRAMDVRSVAKWRRRLRPAGRQARTPAILRPAPCTAARC